MELNHLRYFYEVARAGSFTEAARKLHISQSALSKAVALLEDSEGVKLFERSKKGVELTAIGTEVFQQSAAIFQRLSEIEVTCRGKKEVCEGPLRFGASDHVANYLLVPKIQAMVKAHADVIPSVMTGGPNDITGGMLAEEIEFGLFFTQVPVPQIVYEPLMKIRMAVVCHPRLIPKIKEAVPLKQVQTILRDSGYIGSIQSQYRSSPSQNLMKLLGKNPRIVLEANSQETQKRLCLAGGGVAFLAHFMVEKEIKDGTLAEIQLTHPLTMDLHLARRRDRTLSLNAQTFLNLLREPGR